MKKNRKYSLDKLPDEFRSIFIATTNQIRRFGDVIFLAKFSFLANQIVFLADFGDEEKNSNAILCRDSIYEGFINDKEFVDKKIKLIDENHEEYIQSLYAQGLVYLWTSLESLVKRLIEALINFDKEILTSESFRKINIPIADFFLLSDDEINSYLTDLIINNLSRGYRHGIDKFECYLDAFGLSGAFNGKYKKRILILHHLRNCIIHNDSTVDVRFCKQCDWMKYHVGDRIIVSENDFKAYEESVLSYIQEIFYRLNNNLGAPEEFLKLLRKRIDELFDIRSMAT